MSDEKPNKTSLGLVSWLDVLGYKKVLSADQSSEEPSLAKLDTWHKVWDILKRVRDQQFLHSLTEYLRTERGLCNSTYRTTAFTDSIVMSVDLSGRNLQAFDRWALTELFLLRNAFLARLMFEEGLPIRGGICHGYFLHTDLGFAGDPFVEAEKLSSRLELSACAFSKHCIKYIQSVFTEYPIMEQQQLCTNAKWFVHDCILKPDSADIHGESDCQNPPSLCAAARPYEIHSLHILNFASRGLLKATNDASEFKIDLSTQGMDLTKCVADSFGSHNKPTKAESVQRKIRNTVEMLEVARSVAPQFFS